MSPTDLRVRALELAIESAGHPTDATQHVAAAELFLDFLLAGKRDTTTVNVHVTAPDSAALGREIEKALIAWRRDGGRTMP